jgi:[ribosomal protein S5]-alanine N-acetyltransferase
VPELELLAQRHAGAVLRFERENGDCFARTVPDRGDEYFDGFAARHAMLLAEQEIGACRFHVRWPVDVGARTYPSAGGVRLQR